nr:hypothetical protein [Vibrio splendidus]MCC4880848.1 hypothetical protein [Vibrio splendidus]
MDINEILGVMLGKYAYRLDVKKHDGHDLPVQSFIISVDNPISAMDQIELLIELSENEVNEKKSATALFTVLKVKHSFIGESITTIEILSHKKILDCKNPTRFFEIQLPNADEQLEQN